MLGIAALLAPAVGPTLGGYFVTYVYWQLIFFANVRIGLIGILFRSEHGGWPATKDMPTLLPSCSVWTRQDCGI